LEIEIFTIQDPVKQARFSAVVLPTEETGFKVIAPLHTNVKAIEAALLFATNHQPFVAILGPSGCGKTLLLCAASDYIKAHGNTNVEFMSAEQFLKLESRIGLEKTIILDDCQDVFGKPKQCLRLRLALDRRVRGNRPTMVAFNCSSRDRRINNLLPAPRKWCLEAIGEPNLAGRIALVHHLARKERLNLSPVFTKIIGAKLLGNGRVIAGALQRLKLEKNEWTDSHQILKGCGLLDPYFADNSNWDLRHKIIRVAGDAVTKDPRLDVIELSCFLMIHGAGLCEASVANYLDVDPTRCYQNAAEIARLVKNDASIASLVHHCTESVLSRLA
jgi:energy-coupling factor transporter ATP-binding protein EcfA2